MTDSPPVSKPGVLTRKLGEEWVLYDPRSETMHVINRTAALVWEMCDGEHSVDDMAGRLAADYDGGDADELRRDVRSVLRSFADLGMLGGAEA